MKTVIVNIICIVLAIKLYGIWQLIQIRILPKPGLEVNLTLSKVFDETLPGFNLFDQKNVSMLLSPTMGCDMKHVVIAPSAPRNTDLRNKVRKQFRGKAFLIFILARPPTEDGDNLLEEENTIHGDILQGDFPDSYSTVPFKTVMGFIWVKRFCSSKTKYIAKIDDDSIIDFDKLVSTLDDMDKENNEETISCPSVTRNRKVWRHSEARLMGKWAHSEAEIPGKYLPDYCNGFLYVFSPTVGLALAETALILGQEVHPTRNDEDYVVTGLLAQRLHWVKHRSLAPIGGKSWDNFFSHCPFFDVLRYSFNPIAVGAGSSDSPELQYVGSPHFLICVFSEYVRYQYLLPVGMTWDFTEGFCSRD